MVSTVLAALVGATPPQQGGKTPIDFSANTMYSARHISPDAFRLVETVQFVHEGSIMFCDSAIIFRDQNKLEAFSRVYIIVNDTVSISGEHLLYDGNNRMAELRGKVTLVDPKMTLTTSHLIYDLGKNTAKYSTGGKIVDAENKLLSQWGFYHVNERVFLFKGDVWLNNPEYDICSDTLKYNTQTEVAYFFGPTEIAGLRNRIFCRNGWYDTKNDLASFSKDVIFKTEEQTLTADSLFYDRNLGFGKAMGNVMITDTVQNSIVTGHYAEHFENEKLSIVTNRAMMKHILRGDTLYLHADTLKLAFPDETEARFVFAYNKAKMFRNDFQAMSDSLVYSFGDSIFYLYKNPILWSEDNQLTARQIEIRTANQKISQAHLIDAAFIISKEDELGFNQMKGKEIVCYFEDDEIRKIVVTGSGETLYFVRDDEENNEVQGSDDPGASKKPKGDLVGINKALAQRLVIFAEDKKITGIKFYDKPEATLFPPDDLPEAERKLLNFQWHDALRPKAIEDIFVWKVLEIPVEDEPSETKQDQEGPSGKSPLQERQ